MRQRVVSLIVAFGLLLSAFSPLASLAGAPLAAPGEEKIAPDLAQAVAASGDGQVAYIVMLKEQANLASQSTLADLNQRRRAVYQALTQTANRTQKELLALLEKERGAKRVSSFTPYWIFNGVAVKSDAATLKAIAARPEVAKLELDRVIQLPPVAKGATEPAIQAVEWNIALVRAPQVWAMGYRGQGVAIGSIDTGVQWDHPALRNQYRGWTGSTANHDYNWFDATSNNYQTAPYDDHGHGTHTTGTAVGDDGGANQIGMAPQGKWMAAKAFTASGSGSYSAILAAMQWMQAPRNRQGQNPDPTKAPRVVNNSWGSDDPTYTGFQAAVQSWRAAGIFPAFANGNNGNSAPCTQVTTPPGPMGSPASYPESFGVGATDSSDNIAYFSGRGPSPWQELKPEASAPGVNIRSAYPTNSYRSWQGTSMAAPHVTGLVALLLSIRPGMSVDFLEQTMMATAVDRGLPGRDNCYGAGRIDAFAAAQRVATGTGTLRGALTSGASPITATVTAVHVVTPTMRAEITAYAVYTMTLVPGTYNVGARAFGYNPITHTNVPIISGTVTTRNFSLVATPRYTLSGRVTNQAGAPLTGTVTIQNTPLPPASTNGNGNYLFPQVPAGTYQVTAGANSRFYQPLTRQATIAGNTVLNFALPPLQDSFGYRLVEAPFSWIAGTTRIPLSGDDACTSIPLPFGFNYYGTNYPVGTNLYVSTNGLLTFGSSGCAYYSNTGIPDTSAPNAALYPFWDDLWVGVSEPSRGIYMATVGTAPNRKLVIEWRGVERYGSSDTRATFQVILTEGGGIKLQYQSLSGTASNGSSATVGIENQAGTVGLQYSLNEASLSNGLAMAFVRGPAPQISSVSPNWAARGDSIRVVINGANFQNGATARLRRAGQPDIVGTAVTFVSSSRIDATFAIPQTAELASWGWEVTNPDDQRAVRNSFFEVFFAIQDGAPEITYDSWRGGRHSAVSGGAWRYSNVTGSFIRFSFSTPVSTTLRWRTLTGPNRGRAQVIIDGVNRGTFDNYSAGIVWGVNRSFSVGPGSHVVLVNVTGTKNAASWGYYVDVDSFSVGATVFQENHPNVWYNNWRGIASAAYYGGTARRSAVAGAVAQITIAGTSIGWVTQTGPDQGIAHPEVDGLPGLPLDNYSASTVYRVLYAGGGWLLPGVHVLNIVVSGRKNPASTGYWLVVDAILLRSTSIAMAAEDDPAAMGNEPTGPLGSAKADGESLKAPEAVVP